MRGYGITLGENYNACTKSTTANYYTCVNYTERVLPFIMLFHAKGDFIRVTSLLLAIARLDRVIFHKNKT